MTMKIVCDVSFGYLRLYWLAITSFYQVIVYKFDVFLAVFNVGDYRRQAVGNKSSTHEFFNPLNKEAQVIRQ